MEDESATGFEDVTPDANAQTETSTDKTAASDQTETQTDQATTEATTDSFSDEDLAWAKKKGVDLEDKKAVAKMLRNADQRVSAADVKAKTTLVEAVDQTTQASADDDVVAELRAKYTGLEAKLQAQQYYLDNPDDKQYDAEATTILQELIVSDPELARGLGRNLPSLFALAKARHSESTVAKAKEDGRKEERTALAGKQRASATSQAATNSGASDDSFEADFLKGFNMK